MDKEYYGFCNKINEAAMKGRVMLVTIEVDGFFCSNMCAVEPVRENDDVFEIEADGMTLKFDKKDGMSIEFDEEFQSYIVTDGNYRCEFQ